MPGAGNPNPPRPLYGGNLNEAVRSLQRYFELASLRELVPVPTTPDLTATDVMSSKIAVLNDLKKEKELQSIINEAILDTTGGTRLTPDLIRYFEERSSPNVPGGEILKEYVEILSSELNRLISPQSQTNKNPNSPSKSAPTISALMVHSINVTPATRNSSAVNIFMNAVPSIELARCVPYLSIKIYTPTAPTLNDRIAGMTLIKFLEGAADVTPNSANSLMLSLAQVPEEMKPDDEGRVPPKLYTESGMELFTSPQTLVNVSSVGVTAGSTPLRPTDVLDPFRPFMSILDLSIDVAPTKGMMNYKTAKLSLMLHDRSRLHEVASFVKPDLYSKTELLIEYGWSHPDKPLTGNVWGDFLNAIRVSEKYFVVNSAFQFDDAGQAKIDLSLAMKGGTDVFVTNVATDARIKSAQRAVQELAEMIGRLRSELFSTNSENDRSGIQEIRGVQILDAAESNTGQIEFSKEFWEAFVELDSSLAQSAKSASAGTSVRTNINRLRDSLHDMYGNGKSGGKLGSLKKAINDVLQEKFSLIDSAPDPFLDNDNRSQVSIGKLFTIFVQEPLASTKKFDDIQFIYYSFNNNAALARSKTIGEFSVRKDTFKQAYTKVVESLRGRAMSLFEFVSFVQNMFLDDITSEGYGIGLSGTKRDETGKIKPESINQLELTSKIEELVKKGELPDGTLVMPKTDAYVECVPVLPPAGVPLAAGEGASILRVHVFDRAASPYAIPAMLNSAAITSKLVNIAQWKPGDGSKKANGAKKEVDHNEIAKAILAAAKELGLFENVGELGEDGIPTIRIKGTSAMLKNFIKSVVPSLNYGSQGSAILQLGLKSMQDPRLTTVNMIRAGVQGPMSPEGLGPGGLPIRVAPAQLDTVTFGCPIISYGQQFFVDIGTGTSLDNIYAPFKFTHTISPGKFETRMTLTPLDAYGRYESLISGIGKAAMIVAEGSKVPIR